MKNYLIILLLPLLLISCSSNENKKQESELEIKMNTIAESYVKLVLKTGLFNPNYVDAYYGPDEYKPKGLVADSSLLNDISIEADSLLNELERLASFKATNLEKLRYRFLYKQALAVRSEIYLLQGGQFTFEEEAKNLYDVTLEESSYKQMDSTLNALDKLVPGNGSLQKRLDEFRNQFIVPQDKLDKVFQTAIQECRKRTLEHIKLPENEKFTVEYVQDKPWAAYNWYKGNNYSVIQVNNTLPILIDRIIDLAAHEGYPGHHVYNSLLETNMVDKNKWKEFSVYPLFSPQSFIAEGSANYGIDMIFPEVERVKYEKSILFPLAGLDSSKADLYYRIFNIVEELSFASNKISADYLDGKINKDKAIELLMKYILMKKEKAEQRIRFLETYRSYVINYNVGKKVIKDYIEGHSRNDDERWKLFEEILSTPQTPSGLMEK